jgi:D-glycero-alpha-D-manno-heptose-7-phosphate kinase
MNTDVRFPFGENSVTNFPSSEVAGVRARAPLRLGFAGGGTDLSPFCDEHGGFVMNATVSLYAYAHLAPRSDGKVVFEAAEYGNRFAHDAVPELQVDAGTLLHCGVYNRIVRQFNSGRPLSVSVRTTVDVPSGSGLGGSSTLVVALIEAYRRYLDLPLGEYEIAHPAFEIERLELGIAGGKQDQYAAAFGGFNFMEFYADNRVIINPLRVNSSVQRELEASLVLYFTGRSRNSAEVIESQRAKIIEGNASSVEAMKTLKREAVEMKEAILTGQLDSIAETMNRGWLAKKSTADAVSNDEIERIIEIVLNNGGLAGKVSGAGGGGFLLLLANPSERHRVVEVLGQESGRLLSAAFTHDGVHSWRQLFQRHLRTPSR